MTLDESWFYHMTDHEIILFPPHGKIPDRERVTIQSKRRCSLSCAVRPVRSCDRPREWVKIQRGLLCEQNADTVVWMVV
jgi:hypothetical protein